MSDRILVMKEGRVEATMRRDAKPTEEDIASKMM
jgi:ABC-type sugar transport system ATPase subunit